MVNNTTTYNYGNLSIKSLQARRGCLSVNPEQKVARWFRECDETWRRR